MLAGERKSCRFQRDYVGPFLRGSLLHCWYILQLRAGTYWWGWFVDLLPAALLKIGPEDWTNFGSEEPEMLKELW